MTGVETWVRNQLARDDSSWIPSNALCFREEETDDSTSAQNEVSAVTAQSLMRVPVSKLFGHPPAHPTPTLSLSLSLSPLSLAPVFRCFGACHPPAPSRAPRSTGEHGGGEQDGAGACFDEGVDGRNARNDGENGPCFASTKTIISIRTGSVRLSLRLDAQGARITRNAYRVNSKPPCHPLYLYPVILCLSLSFKTYTTKKIIYTVPRKNPVSLRHEAKTKTKTHQNANGQRSF